MHTCMEQLVKSAHINLMRRTCIKETIFEVYCKYLFDSCPEFKRQKSKLLKTLELDFYQRRKMSFEREGFWERVILEFIAPL